MVTADADVGELVVAELHQGPAVPPNANFPCEGGDQGVERRADAVPPAFGDDALSLDPHGGRDR